MGQKGKQNLILALALIILGGGLILGGKLLMDLREKPTGDMTAKVYELTPDGRKLVETLTLSEGANTTYEFHGKLGITVVEVDGQRARVKSSPCPDQVCVQFGWLSFNGDFSSCLPNSMMVVVEGDGIAY